MVEKSVGTIIGLTARDLFITLKCILLVVKSIQVSIRYYRTYDTIIQFEIWYFLLSAWKVAVLVPNIIIVVNINYMFAMFVVNSLMLITSNYFLHMKALSAMYNRESSVNFSVLLAVRLFFLFCIVMWAMYPVFGLRCSPDVYPDQLAALMFLDFVNSLTDLVITCKMPRHLTRIKEQRRRAGSILGGLEPPMRPASP